MQHERGKPKCEKYWPDEEKSEVYGGKHKVTNVREDSSQDYTLRELLLCRVTEEGEIDKKVRGMIT